MQQTNKRYFISVSEYLSRNISQCYPLISKISIAHPGSGNNFIKKDTYQKNSNRFVTNVHITKVVKNCRIVNAESRNFN